MEFKNVNKEPPDMFVSVLGHLVGMEPFPDVREVFMVSENKFYCPALEECVPVDYWADMPVFKKG